MARGAGPILGDVSSSDLYPRLAAIVAFLPELESPEFTLGTWAGGERLSDGSISMPYYELSPRGQALVTALGAWVEPFDWMTWLRSADGQALTDDPSRMARATPEDLSRLLTAVVRSERFGDGNLEGALRSGLLLRVARRAAALLEERGQRPDR